MTLPEGDWFTERSPMWPGRALSLQIKRRLHSRRSSFQLIEVFETEACGRMLALDGVIQLTESDEFAYQEMLAQVPLFAHPRPEKVLVIGGGDGGVVREVARHPGVLQIDVCELDAEVVDVCRRWIPSTGVGFDDPRVRIHFEDGAAFARRAPAAYDVILVDSTDPVGPGKSLFGEAFHADARRSLARGGILAAQGKSIFLHFDLVSELMRIFARLYARWGYALALVPTYPGGHIGICVGSIGPDPTSPARPQDPGLQADLRYYSPSVHAAAFVLPAFGQRLVEKIGRETRDQLDRPANPA